MLRKIHSEIRVKIRDKSFFIPKFGVHNNNPVTDIVYWQIQNVVYDAVFWFCQQVQ